MTDPVIHPIYPTELLQLARNCVADGSIIDPETPALLRRVAEADDGETVVLAVAVVALIPVAAIPGDDFALVEHEVRPGVRNYRLARLPRNDERRVRIGAFERMVHRNLVIFVRRLVRLLRSPLPLVRSQRPGERALIGTTSPHGVGPLLSDPLRHIPARRS